ncbi:MAG: hypothetical protein Q9194_000940 [Teloschistes cf. exilis]
MDRDSRRKHSKRLPEGSKIIGIFPFGHSYFTRTAKIQTVQADGTPRSLFLKVTQNEVGKAMVSGEYESMKALHSTSPDLTPEPIAWGTFAQADHVHLFLCEFVDMIDDLPAIEPTMKMLAGTVSMCQHCKALSHNLRSGPIPGRNSLPSPSDWFSRMKNDLKDSTKKSNTFATKCSPMWFHVCSDLWKPEADILNLDSSTEISGTVIRQRTSKLACQSSSMLPASMPTMNM